MSDSTLDDLAQAAKDGGRREMEAFLEELRPLVCRWALVSTGSPDAAEDVAQRVLMKVYGAVRTYEPEGRVTTWVYRITRNALIDGQRRRGRRGRLRDELELNRLAQEVSSRNDAGPLAPMLLRQLFDGLSPRQRAVIDLVDLQGFEAKEVAEMLEIEPETVRVHLHRARAALRARVEEQGSEEEDESDE